MIAFAWAVSVISLVTLIVRGITEGTGFGVIVGLVGTLTPALVDAVRVESRRRTPGKRAIADDVQPEG